MSRSHLPATGTVHSGTWLWYALALPWYCPLSGQPLVQPLVRSITKPRRALTSGFVLNKIFKSFNLRISRANYSVDHSTLPQSNFNCKFKIQICNSITVVNGHQICRRTKAWITKTNTPLGRGESIDGQCANGMPANGTRNASSSSPRNPSSERIRHISQREKKTHGRWAHLQTRISSAHCRLLD